MSFHQSLGPKGPEASNTVMMGSSLQEFLYKQTALNRANKTQTPHGARTVSLKFKKKKKAHRRTGNCHSSQPSPL